MPGASLIALLDDIASVLDDVALLTKVATKKTAGVLGDDLALNAQQVHGVRAATLDHRGRQIHCNSAAIVSVRPFRDETAAQRVQDGAQDNN